MTQVMVDPHGRDAALTALYYLGQREDLSAATLFRLLSNPQPDMALRDLEPPLGYFVRHADPDLDGAGLRDAVELNLRQQDWPVVQRGGYLLDLLCYFSPQHAEWQRSLLPWLDDVTNQLPEVPLLPFFPRDSRHNPMDALAVRWRLSSGVLYDRLKRLLRPPYVC
ncbi:hypothetical protein ACJU26_03715 [Acidithiobacillus sp. M4-SHS-6]|uniref:hypothetical protein n=1 Tax=Acidithiobacillus sp. M4-SHS-6 TaxID=3383024 RepID=UPI0039BE5A77